MRLKSAQECQVGLLVPTSMGIRMTPIDRQAVHVSKSFIMQATSAESNVASVCSYLGLPVKVLTKFVQDSPISRFIRDDLAGRHLTYEGKEVAQGGPWGYRHQINFADSGCGVRGPRVYNDRAGEVGRTLSAADFDLERIFNREGVRLVHLSGLIAALSPQTSAFCLELARAAQKCGTCISFDLNYRASFWKNRESELASVFQEIAQLSDVLVGNEEDFQLCLGIRGPEAGGKELKAKIDGFKSMIEQVRQTYSHTSVFATTLRQVVDADTHLWGAILAADSGWQVVEPRAIKVLDRIGGGDGFVGGLLYALLKEWEMEKWIQFGWACGALATSYLTDYVQPADEEEVWSVWHGNARVKR